MRPLALGLSSTAVWEFARIFDAQDFNLFEFMESMGWGSTKRQRLLGLCTQLRRQHDRDVGNMQLMSRSVQASILPRV